MRIEDLALTFIPHLGPRGIVHLLEIYGSAASIFNAEKSDLIERALLRADIADYIVNKRGFAEAEREIKYCNRNAIDIIASTDSSYPPLIKTTPDYPHILYIQGKPDALCSKHTLSIVGTRRMTTYGERICNEIIEGIANMFPDTVIVSGLAFGVDTAAHRAAVTFGLRSVGIVANALPEIVPSQNTALARNMIDDGGAIITEVSSQTKQNGNLYIPRNRIVAAISEGLIIVESPINGGSISTVNAADGYSRSVMAVPGRATDIMSAGTNALIKNQIAQLVVSAKDVAKYLGWETDYSPERVHAEPRELTSDENCVLNSFPESGDSISFEELESKSRLNIGTLTAVLLDLELSGDIRSLPGKMYEKLNR